MEDNTFTIDTEIKTDGIEKGTKDVSKSLTKMAGTIAMAGAKSALAFTAILKILPLLVKSASKGFKDLAKFDEDFNKSMSSIMNSSRYLQGSLATAFGGLVEAIEPIVITVLDSLAEMFNRFAEIVAYLNGRDTFSKAIKQQEDYAKAVDKTAGKLASFDKLNVIGQKKNGLAFTTEDVKVSDEVKKRYEGLKKILEEIKKLFKGDLEGFDAGNAGSIIGEAIVKSINLVDEIVKSIDAKKLGEKLGEAIGSINIGEILISVAELIWDIGEDVFKGIAGFIEGWYKENPLGCAIAMTLTISKITSMLTGSEFMAKIWNALGNKLPNGSLMFGNASKMIATLAMTLGIALTIGQISEHLQNKTDKEWVKLIIKAIEKMMQGFIIGATFGPELGIAGMVLAIPVFIKLNWGEIDANLDKAEEQINKAMDSLAVKTVKKITGREDITSSGTKSINLFGDGGAFNKSTSEKWNDTVDFFKNDLPDFFKRIFHIKTPGLATGAVIPPNAPFTAVLGDNKRETEIVSPLSTMKQALAEALAEYGGDTRVVLELDGETIYNSVVKRNRKNTARTGVNYMM